MDFSLMDYNHNYDHSLKKLLSVDTIMCGVHGLGWKKANIFHQRMDAPISSKTAYTLPTVSWDSKPMQMIGIRENENYQHGTRIQQAVQN